ncbi:MAG TPA: hypothetical protein VFS67_25635 [Polyangiaceae bacterium]|jgi:hypothetical protein|nr:hypothetical protein [Polyangiaceae bacterium]
MLRWLAPCILASASLACGQGRLLDDITASATRLRLVPESFLGNVPCQKGAAGALQSYVARFEQAPFGPYQADAGVLRLTSGPVPCDQAVVLNNNVVLAGFAYVADIYGFDTPPGETAPPLSSARWTASCGRGGGTADAGAAVPTYAVYGQTVLMGGCTTFSGHGGSGSTRLLVDQASALGSLSCGSGPGQVSRFEGVLGSQRVSAACGQALAFDVSGPSQFHSIALTAFEASASPGPVSPSGTADVLDASVLDAAASDAALDAGGSRLDAGVPLVDAGEPDAGADPGVPRWTSECLGKSVPGVSAIATCDPLVAIP